LNLGFKSKAQAFFVDIDGPSYEGSTSVNVILSPSMYWVKRVKLPVKYLRDVRSLIPSLFEEHLPAGKYSYYTYKDGESFLIFAYNDKEVLDLLAEKNITSANMNNVYLAQSELSTLEAPKKINEDDILSVENGVVVKLPAVMAPDAEALDLNAHTFSKHTIHLTRFNQIADKKSQMVFGVILLVLTLMFGVEWLITSSKVTSIMQKQESVFSDHHLQSTFFQNEAIYAKLNNTFDRQTRIRDIMNLALTLKLKPEERFERIALEKRKVVLVIKTPSKAQGDKSLSKLKKRFQRTSGRFDNGIYVMEIMI